MSQSKKGMAALAVVLSACSSEAAPSPGAGGTSSASGGASGTGGAAVSGGAPSAGGVPGDTADPVTVRFDALVAGETFACGRRYAAVGAARTAVEPSDLRFFVQAVSLVSASGSEVPIRLDARSPWQTREVALLDFEDGTAACINGGPELNATITGRIPKGEYRGISFEIGVPERLNHLPEDLWPAPLQSGNMSWGWATGFKFFVAEVFAADVGALASYDAGTGVGIFHVGSTGCGDGDGGGAIGGCTRPNRPRITLADFQAARDVVVLDLEPIFSGVDIAGGLTCHSSVPECAALFEHVGLDFATGLPGPAQDVFGVRRDAP